MDNNKVSRYETLKKCDGISYVELLVALALLSSVLIMAFAFFGFSKKNLMYNQNKYVISQDVRNLMTNLEYQIHKAKKVTIGMNRYKAVEVFDGGMTVKIYVDIDRDSVPELVQYKLDSENRLVMGTAEQGMVPTTWTAVTGEITNNTVSPKIPIFQISGNKVSINLSMKDNSTSDGGTISMKGSYSVRSKGAME